MAEFHCIPMRSGWLSDWVVDGVPIFNAGPQIRVTEGTELRVRMPAESVSALIHLDGRDPEHRYILPLGRVK